MENPEVVVSEVDDGDDNDDGEEVEMTDMDEKGRQENATGDDEVFVNGKG